MQLIQRSLLAISFFICNAVQPSYGQKTISSRIDSLITTRTNKPFNGIILIAQNGKTIYQRCYGYSNFINNVPLQTNDQYVIGSISKEITAVLLLQEVEKGHIQLNAPIRTYLKNLKATWADTVTVHQLLTHTHGITALNQPLAFRPGTQYQYSQIGYELIARILRKTTHRSFASLSADLFKKCGMTNTHHPDIHIRGDGILATGYSEASEGNLAVETNTFKNYVPAALFISTADDLLKFNTCLHNGQLLTDSLYRRMIIAYAVRQHPVFGKTNYGYGLTIDDKDGIRQLGLTGLVPGFASMDFYYPETKTSIIILENVTWYRLKTDDENLNKTFYYQLQIMKMVKEQLK
jgi:D-alanyl-D-alanine carboxypeptidase